MKRFLVLACSLALIGCSKSDSPTSPASNQTPTPVAGFTWTGVLVAPATITFSNTSQHANKYRWSFGDGASSELISPTHTFQNYQTYSVRLIATDSSSAKSDTLTQTLTVARPDPVADFTWSGTTVTPAQVNFANNSRNADAYYWDLGDGRTSIQLAPSITYTTYGSYTITLIARANDSQKSDTLVKVLTITPGKVYLESIILDQMPFVDGAGAGWDLATGPEVYFSLLDAGGTPIVVSQYYQDVTPNQLPLQWTATAPGTRMSDWSGQLSFLYYDYDDGSNDDFIGGIGFRINTLIAARGYLRSYSLQAAGITMRMGVRWE